MIDVPIDVSVSLSPHQGPWSLKWCLSNTLQIRYSIISFKVTVCVCVLRVYEREIGWGVGFLCCCLVIKPLIE